MIEVDYEDVLDHDVIDHDDKINDDDNFGVHSIMMMMIMQFPGKCAVQCAWLGEPCQICRQMTAKG